MYIIKYRILYYFHVRFSIKVTKKRQNEHVSVIFLKNGTIIVLLQIKTLMNEL